jgi:2-haloacid dehalogenase
MTKEAEAEHFVFDAFGTLFDVHSVAREHAALLGPNWPRLSEIWRNKQLEYTWIYAGLNEHYPFRDITRLSLHYALRMTGLDEAIAPRLLESYQRLAAFPEVESVLRALKARGAKLAILSNGDTDMLDDLVEGANLDGVFDALISTRVAGTFKPVPKVYALATEVFNVKPDAITFVSSNRWDIAGAASFGFQTIWVNRAGNPDEYPQFPASKTMADLTALADVLP